MGKQNNMAAALTLLPRKTVKMRLNKYVDCILSVGKIVSNQLVKGQV
jgi:hypothetical protein